MTLVRVGRSREKDTKTTSQLKTDLRAWNIDHSLWLAFSKRLPLYVANGTF
jgi:hypothetical protein